MNNKENKNSGRPVTWGRRRRRKEKYTGKQTYRNQLETCNVMFQKLNLDSPFYEIRAKTAPILRKRRTKIDFMADPPATASGRMTNRSSPRRLEKNKTFMTSTSDDEDARSESTTSSAEFDKTTGTIRRRHRFAPKELRNFLKMRGVGDPCDNDQLTELEEKTQLTTRRTPRVATSRRVQKISPYVQDEMRFKSKLDYVESYSKIKLFCEYEARRANAYKPEAEEEDRQKYIDFVNFLNQTTELQPTTPEELEARLPEDLLSRIESWIVDCEKSFGLSGRASLIEESVASAIVNRNIMKHLEVPSFEPKEPELPPPEPKRRGVLR